MKCSICGEEIVLSPSAKERAERYGGAASHYTRLFTTHAECVLAQRRAEPVSYPETPPSMRFMPPVSRRSTAPA